MKKRSSPQYTIFYKTGSALFLRYSILLNEDGWKKLSDTKLYKLAFSEINK